MSSKTQRRRPVALYHPPLVADKDWMKLEDFYILASRGGKREDFWIKDKVGECSKCGSYAFLVVFEKILKDPYLGIPS